MVQRLAGKAADRGAIVTFHPLQMASAVLVVLFAIGLYAGTKMVPRQHVNWDHPQLVVQVSAMPI